MERLRVDSEVLNPLFNHAQRGAVGVVGGRFLEIPGGYVAILDARAGRRRGAPSLRGEVHSHVDAKHPVDLTNCLQA
jgi:hypothetical protein